MCATPRPASASSSDPFGRRRQNAAGCSQFVAWIHRLAWRILTVLKSASRPEAARPARPPRPPAIPFIGNVFPLPPALEEVPLPLLLPRIGADGQNGPSVGILSLKEFTDLVAPKLDQDEEIYALGLADGAREFFGDEIGGLILGERVLSTQTVDLVLKAVRSGVLGRNDLIDVSSDLVQSILQFLQNAIDAVRRGSPSAGSTLESEFYEALDSLDDMERSRFDDIVTELTQSALRRAVTRLSTVDRIL